MDHRLPVAIVAALLAGLSMSAQAQLATQAPSPLNSITTLTPNQPAPAPAAKLDTKLSSGTKAGGVVELDRIVAIVNNEVITANDLNDRMAMVVCRQNCKLQKSAQPAEPSKDRLAYYSHTRYLQAMTL